MRISLSVSQNELEDAADGLIREMLTELSGAVAEETRGLEQDLEKITRLAVKGKLWRAWKSNVYPKKGGPARVPTGEIVINGGSRSRGALTYFTQSGRIVSGGGGYLAIPKAAAGNRGPVRNLTPGEWEQRTGKKLRFVYRRNQPSLLVLDEGVLSGKNQIARGNTARRLKTGRGNTTIPIFILVPAVDFSPRFSINPLIERRKGMLRGNIESRLSRFAQ